MHPPTPSHPHLEGAKHDTFCGNPEDHELSPLGFVEKVNCHPTSLTSACESSDAYDCQHIVVDRRLHWLRHPHALEHQKPALRFSERCLIPPISTAATPNVRIDTLTQKTQPSRYACLSLGHRSPCQHDALRRQERSNALTFALTRSSPAACHRESLLAFELGGNLRQFSSRVCLGGRDPRTYRGGIASGGLSKALV